MRPITTRRAPTRARAFTLIELVITLAIIVTITAFTVPQLVSASTGTLHAQAKATLGAALNAIAADYARTGGTPPGQPSISRATIRSLYPDLRVTDPGEPSTNTGEVSVATVYQEDVAAWRVGVAVLVRGNGNDPADCYFAWRDTDPPVSSVTRAPSGPALETFYVATAETPGVVAGCTGVNALGAVISDASRDANPLAGTLPGVPARVLTVPQP
jgi:prepilin-type N-terminal cleavage/methylation domain-containing protein